MNDAIGSTLCPKDAATRQWDAVVAGAGIAGATVAGALASRGQRVLLLDRSTFPRGKVCGGCLNSRAIRTLHRLGFGEVVDPLPARILDSFELHAQNGGTAKVPIGGGAMPPRAISRTRLDTSILRESIRCGAEFLDDARAMDSYIQDDSCIIRVRNGGQEFGVRARMVLACDGIGSALARSAGLCNDAPMRGLQEKAGVALLSNSISVNPSAIVMLAGAFGYLGIVAVEDGLADVAGALRLDYLRSSGSPGAAIESVLREFHGRGFHLLPGFTPDGVMSCGKLHRRVNSPVAERLFLVGDAAGYVEPITGEGMAWALGGAEQAAIALEHGWSPEAARIYTAAWRRHIAARRKTVMGLAGVLDRPALMRACIYAAKVLPSVARLVPRHLNREASPSFRLL